MKNRIFVLLLIAVLMVSLFTGCRRAEATLESVENAVEHRIESAGEELKQALTATTAPAAAHAPVAAPTTPAAAPDPVPAYTVPAAAITAEQAQKIALDHAGFTSEQVTRLHTDYEIDRGIPHYDVEFDAGRWEYDYEISAETGEILSYEKDD